MSVAKFGSELEAARGYSAQSYFKHLAAALGIKSTEKITREACDKTFSMLDADDSGQMDLDELVNWAKRCSVFGPDMDDATVVKTASRLYRESGAPNPGMTREFFFKFIVSIQNEHNQLAYASRHHLLSIPKSLQKANKKDFTLDSIEKQLHQKIQQATTRDSDRARHIVNMFKTQLQRDTGEVDTVATDGLTDNTISITKPQFRKVLNLLGLFATNDQADALFEKYDINGDGDLTVHEFLTKAYPDDYPGLPPLDESRYYDFRMGGAGKRLFPEEGIGGRPKTPHHAVYSLNPAQMAATIRAKIEQHHRSGIPVSIPLGRRKLAKSFENNDASAIGWVTRDKLKESLNAFGITYGENQYNELMSLYPYEGDYTKFDYVLFCLAVYPLEAQQKDIPTSLIHNSPHSAHNREVKAAQAKAATNSKSPTNRRPVHSAAADAVSLVHTTGFYYKPSSPSSAMSPNNKINIENIPQSPASSRQVSSRLQHQLRMTQSRGSGRKDNEDWRTAILP